MVDFRSSVLSGMCLRVLLMNSNPDNDAIGTCICGDVLRPVTRAADRAAAANSIPGASGQFGPGVAT